MPEPYTAIEKTFSFKNELWMDGKNRFLVSTIKAIIILKNIYVMIFMIFFNTTKTIK